MYEAVLESDFAPWKAGERVAVKLHNEPNIALLHAQYVLRVSPRAFDHSAVVTTRVAFDIRGLCVYVQSLCTPVAHDDDRLPAFLKTIVNRLSSSKLAHTDIKLQNILAAPDGSLRLCDLDSLCAPRGALTPYMSVGFGGYSQYLFPASSVPTETTLHADYNWQRGEKHVQDAAMAFSAFMTQLCEVEQIDGLQICVTNSGADITSLAGLGGTLALPLYNDLVARYALAVKIWQADTESASLFKSHFENVQP